MKRVFVYFLAVLPLSWMLAARADILDTKHNLTEKSSGQSSVSSEERKRLAREVCVFCHTPGSAEDEAGGGGDVLHAEKGATPQWQRSVEVALSFELFDDIGRMGTDGSAQPVGSVSVACMSCHDSVQAFGVVQGSSSDHPFGVPYRGLFRFSDAGSQFRDRLMASSGDIPARMAGYTRDESEFRPARSAVINKRQVWWAAVTDSGQKTKSDLPLYPRRLSGAGGYEQVPFVECTTCHDPHSDRPVFLRTDNEQSKVCMTCHIK